MLAVLRRHHIAWLRECNETYENSAERWVNSVRFMKKSAPRSGARGESIYNLFAFRRWMWRGYAEDT